MFFEHFMPPDLIAEAVDERIKWYREKLERMQSCDRSGWGAGPENSGPSSSSSSPDTDERLVVLLWFLSAAGRTRGSTPLRT